MPFLLLSGNNQKSYVFASIIEYSIFELKIMKWGTLISLFQKSLRYVCHSYFFRRSSEKKSNCWSVIGFAVIFQISFIHLKWETKCSIEAHVLAFQVIDISSRLPERPDQVGMSEKCDNFRLFWVFARFRMVAKGTAVKCFLCHASVPYTSNDRQRIVLEKLTLKKTCAIPFSPEADCWSTLKSSMGPFPASSSLPLGNTKKLINS